MEVINAHNVLCESVNFFHVKKIVFFARRKEELIKNILSEEYDNEGEVDQQSFIAEQQR